MASRLQEAVQRYAELHSDFASAAQHVEEFLRTAIESRSIHGHASARAKSVLSFGQKVIRKRYSDPWQEVTDKVAGRVVVYLPSDVDAVVQVIGGLLLDPRIEDKRAVENPKLTEYSGVHLTGPLPGLEVRGDPLEVEVQVRTAAQHAWSEVDHMLIYKPALELPLPDQRAISRLGVLAEVFDEEVARVLVTLRSSTGYDLLPLLDRAQELGLGVGIGRGDRHLSFEVLGAIRTALPGDLVAYGDALAVFVAANETRIAHLVGEAAAVAGEGGLWSYLLVAQPEALIILERLTSAPMTLERAWAESGFSSEILDPFRSLVG